MIPPASDFLDFQVFFSGDAQVLRADGTGMKVFNMIESWASDPTALAPIAWRLADIAIAAGGSIMNVYDAPGEVDLKADGSPLTAADLASEAIIAARLAAEFPGLPVISEEAAIATCGLGARGETFLLVDPLDGTKEFISRSGEFTVNIAVIAGGRPVAGVVYAPALAKLWLGVLDAEAALVRADAATGRVGDAARQPIRVRPRPAGGLTAVASRSHLDAKTAAFLAGLPVADRNSIGSSLKFCLVAEGLADVYPRFGPTMEWDTAAGQAVLEAACGRVLAPEGAPLRYGKATAGYKNGAFIAWGG
jgi:3'(2'), 5'-bisphosphate nucleotidase